MSSCESPPFDAALAHRHFSVECFNRTWKLMDTPTRTPEDDDAMVLAAAASLWHWTQRADCTERNLSVGHWQVSRAYALLGRREEAMWHAERCLAHSEHLPPFYLAYAHEAVARAALAAADAGRLRDHLEQARRHAAAVTDDAERGLLEKDLSDLAGAAGPAA
jgi:hypothetical protein